jgi:nicotinate-nucleotide pyrophosphorylase (carboxylating)
LADNKVSQIKLGNYYIKNIVKLALNEDLYPSGDITSELVKNNKIIKIKLISNQQAIVAGLEFAKQTFKLIDNKIKFIIKKKEGSRVKKNDVIATIQGKAENILIGERVALNFMSHISGVATKTNQFVKLVGKKCKVCCTRKTIPTLRVIQKYAVKLGGGINHRFNLSDEFLIKDNHIASSDIRTLVTLAIKNKKGRKITVEIDNLNQLKKIIGLKFNTVLFDNMDNKTLKAGVKMTKKYYETEASGNINLKTVKKIVATGVDRVSIGGITHSTLAIDFKLEI